MGDGVVGLVVVLVLNGHVMTPFYALAVLPVLPIIGKLKVKGEMTPEVRNVHEFFIGVEKAVRKAGAR